MEYKRIKKSKLLANQFIRINGSKSESNRLLILQSCFGNIDIDNLSDSEDTMLLKKALDNDCKVIDVHHAGTAMRFLTSYFASLENAEVVLTGSERLIQRPIKDLVDALKTLGADIQYTDKKGSPPLKIFGKNLEKNRVKINANISSQFISSLLLVAGKLQKGLTLELVGALTSRPYLQMTVDLLKSIGISVDWSGNSIKISPKIPSDTVYKMVVESDWSSASYFYSLAAIGRKEIRLGNFKPNSLQGDSRLVEIYKNHFGINTHFDIENHHIILKPNADFSFPKSIDLDLNDCPDIAQTLCVTATALGIPFHFKGLKTLKIKETDRLVALKNELKKIGCNANIDDQSIASNSYFKPEKNSSIATYQDHRMAMSFAPFALVGDIEIQDPSVVQKSYPNFWTDLSRVLNPL
ncbi:3-phosphoshikimate 1-carboxyvinyltransferase [Amniculibacterium sp. G2-70]|uniref:3-phosphoshikimate 1-carboxyvinyltransferase n=1 Tax=Amniculibacterium sp. G2-70 TaxID=2767188 RepID=UPI0016545837|nr:3-phosphoshikimate 1-carboxyvinyltransferase [Amniculibacterium sp. G2-70]